MSDDSRVSNPDDADNVVSPSPDSPPARLRIWPAIALIIGMVATRAWPSLFEDSPTGVLVGGFGPLLCSALVVLWWLFASRATWRERIFGTIGVAIALTAIVQLSDPTMVGPATVLLTVPVGMATFAIGAILFSRARPRLRTTLILLLTICAFGSFATLRSDGMWGDASLGLHWRWSDSPEQMLLAEKEHAAHAESVALSAEIIDSSLSQPEWPAFRGADRSGSQLGSQIVADWSAERPQELWRIAVGPAWSSFAVAGRLLFTQEQRGSEEMVVCYDADSGRELWNQPVQTRFDEALGGPGPRATPTIDGNSVFAMGASGYLTRLAANSGDVVWQVDIRAVAGREPPTWGFASSPLVVDGLVIVHAGGPEDLGILAFDAASGELRWSAAAGDNSYSSPQLNTVAGEELVLMLTNAGAHLLEPESGQSRLNYEWEHPGYRVLQPKVLDEYSLLIPTDTGSGTRRIRVTQQAGILAAEEVWTSRNLKPDFNDFVVFENHAYGFDGRVFTCIDLETGDRRWKRGRYGKGQVLLLKEPGLLLVTSETGELVLLSADPTAHTELAKMQVLSGKTWNHPVLVGDRLYIRNGQEAACLRLPTAPPASDSLASRGAIQVEW